MTQKEFILEHLRRYGSIEPLTALREYGCYRLAAVIGSLRSEGRHITTRRLEGYSKITGRKVMFAQYILDDDLQSEKPE